MSEVDNKTERKTLHNSENITFIDFRLSPEVLQAVEAIGYETPSPIQAEVIPHLMEGRDIIGIAPTGTGKTGAFALPLLSQIDIRSRLPQILCLAPTRELAIQVAEAFQSYAKFIQGFSVLPIYGGTDYRRQLRQLSRGVQVVVGTPGRTMDHMRKGTLLLDNVKALILDEADEMLRMGFIDDVEWILEQMPDDHQTALFSATMPRQVRNIANRYLNNPAEITIKVKKATAPAIRPRSLQMRNNEKLETLTRLLEVEQSDGVLIFVRTKNATLEVAERLKARGYSAEALNGDIAQSHREKTVASLKNGVIDIIVGTDVAARGLDIHRISHVINYDVPYDTESYVHRIGRTGRAGREGDAILFVNYREKRMLRAMEQATRQTIKPYEFPSVDVLNERKMGILFARIDTELQKELKEYHSVIKKYVEHNPEVDPLALAAALTSLEGDSKPFYIKEPPKRARREREDRRRDYSDRRSNDRFSRGGRGGDRFSRGGDRGGNRGGDRQRGGGNRFQRDDIPMATYRLAVGETHGVRKGDIVGAIANEAGIPSKVMGKIYIYEEHSLIDLPADITNETMQVLKKVWVRGQQINLAQDSGGRQSGGGESRSFTNFRKNKPRSKDGKRSKPRKPKRNRD